MGLSTSQEDARAWANSKVREPGDLAKGYGSQEDARAWANFKVSKPGD